MKKKKMIRSYQSSQFFFGNTKVTSNFLVARVQSNWQSMCWIYYQKGKADQLNGVKLPDTELKNKICNNFISELMMSQYVQSKHNDNFQMVFLSRT